MTNHEKLKLMVAQGRITQGDTTKWICPECLIQLGPMHQAFALERAAVNHCTGHLAFSETENEQRLPQPGDGATRKTDFEV